MCRVKTENLTLREKKKHIEIGYNHFKCFKTSNLVRLNSIGIFHMHHRTTIGNFQKIIENEKESKDCTRANTPLSQKIKKTLY